MKKILILSSVLLLAGCSYKEPKINTVYKYVEIEKCSKQIPVSLTIPAKEPEIPVIEDEKKDADKINKYIIDIYFTNKQNASKLKQINKIITK
jgi:hypothetical protein